MKTSPREIEEQSSMRLAAIVNSSEDAIISKTLDGIITSWNPGATRIFGYSAQEVIGKPMLTLFPPERVSEETEILARIGRGESVNHFETVRVRKDGERIDISVSLSPITDKAGKIIGASKIARDITQRKRGEEALQKERDFVSALVNTVSAIVVVLDRQARIVRFNRACEQLTGFSFEEAKGQDVMDLLLMPEERAPARAEFGRLSAGQFPNTFENHWVTKDGTPHLIAWSNTALLNPHGEVEYVVANGIDITERKRAESALSESERKFRTLFDMANDAIYMLHEGVFVDCNAMGLELLGVARDQFIGRSPVEFSPKVQPDGRDSADKAMEFIQRALARKPQFFEWLLCRPGGTVVYTEISLNQLEVGGKVYLQAVVRDITERKHAEEKIAEQAALLDKARDAILVCDLQGHILFWNQGAERVYGWSREELLGRDVSEILDANPGEFEKIQEKTISTGGWYGELHHLTKDRHEITLEARWTLIRDNEGKPKSLLAINTDITEKKKIEAQFMRAQRMESIGTLAGGVAHDLNNILAPIMMSIEVLKTVTNHPQAKEILETIELSAKRGADIVRQVLSFARGLEGQRIEVQPKHLLKDLENIIKDTFPKDIRLQFSVPRDTWTILGDPTQVHQVLLNLCVNARDAMPHGGSLTISVNNCALDEQYAAMNLEAKAGRYVKISVTDTGTGIPPNLLEKIFEPFFTTKDMNKGTGLGLSTVMAVVKSHGGLVNVYSEHGKGTTFKVYLPAVEGSSDAQADGQQQNLPRGNGETVLVADDEASVLTITSQTLRAFGYRVLTAVNGAAAVAVYAEHKTEIAVVLTDMMMPVMDGSATIHALMQMNPRVKIVASSGLDENASMAKASGAGVKHFLTKPCTAGTLLKTLHSILQET
jgi:PAS domain S-box-containing protein